MNQNNSLGVALSIAAIEEDGKTKENNLHVKTSSDIEGRGSNSSEIKLIEDIGLDDPDTFPEGGRKANLSVLGAFIGLIGTLGFVNASGVIQSYISSNILMHESESNIGWIFSIYNFMSFGLSLIVGPIFDRIGCKIPIFAGIILQTAGFMCLSVSRELYQFILSYSILGGIGTSLTFSPFLGVCSHHFLRKRAQAIGLAYVGGAVGGIIFPLVFRSLFPKLGFGWAIRISAFMVFAFLTIGWLLVVDRADELNKIERMKVEKETGIEVSDNDGASQIVLQILQSIDLMVFKDKIYSLLVLSLLGNGFAFLISLTYIPSYASANGAGQSASFLLMVVFNSMSIPGRIIPGILADKYGRFNTLCIINLLSTMAFFIVWLPPPVGHKLIGIYIFSGFYGFTSGSILSLAPACIGQICETKDFGKRYGTAYFALSFGDLIGIPIGGVIIGASKSQIKGFDNLVIFISVLSFVGTVSAFGARILYKGFKFMAV